MSRLVADVERFPNDADERMAAIGMGAVYRRLSTGGVLRADDPSERKRADGAVVPSAPRKAERGGGGRSRRARGGA